MRCSSPGVPGIAHGRARVCSSRRYGQNSAFSAPSALLSGPVWTTWFALVANAGSISGSSDSSGMRQGSEPLASMPSDSSITGVR